MPLEIAMTVVDLEQSVRGALREAGLLQYVDEDQTQFLEFPDGWFAEIVVKDGSKLRDVERVVQRYKERLRRNEAGDLDEIVRPVWTIAKLERVGPSVSLPGLEPAIRFNVTLRSGGLSCNVKVDFTDGAIELTRKRLRETKAPEETALEELVHEFMELHLTQGGRSFWDPRRVSRLELDAAAFMAIMGRRDSVELLKASIEAVFNPPEHVRLDSIRSYLKLVSMGGRNAHDFKSVLADLPGPGGAFHSGDKLPTSNYELYSTLFDSEQEALRRFYLDHLRKAEMDFPELKNEFPNALS